MAVPGPVLDPSAARGRQHLLPPGILLKPSAGGKPRRYLYRSFCFGGDRGDPYPLWSAPTKPVSIDTACWAARANGGWSSAIIPRGSGCSRGRATGTDRTTV